MAIQVESILEKALVRPLNLSREEILEILKLEDAGLLEKVFASSGEIKARTGRDKVLRRALIETSNVCARDCYYCGIRKSNTLKRYQMSEDEIALAVSAARAQGFDAIAFQGGEIESEANTVYYEKALHLSKGMEVTLSLGEQSEEVYRRWKNAGAMRYLLRIETSNRELYSKLHPSDASFDRRVECLRILKRLGYITGTGVMIALPGQSLDDLASDILFFGDVKADMVGMGPWIAHKLTPLGEAKSALKDPLTLTLKMIALARLYLHNVNIVASTAIETISPGEGRELALRAGANVVMPNFTPEGYRGDYDLYPGKVMGKLGVRS
jgi:biotin synthase